MQILPKWTQPLKVDWIEKYTANISAQKYTPYFSFFFMFLSVFYELSSTGGYHFGVELFEIISGVDNQR